MAMRTDCKAITAIQTSQEKTVNCGMEPPCLVRAGRVGAGWNWISARPDLDLRFVGECGTACGYADDCGGDHDDSSVQQGGSPRRSCAKGKDTPEFRKLLKLKVDSDSWLDSSRFRDF